VQFFCPLLCSSTLKNIVVVSALAVLTPCALHAEARLVVEADSGRVLEAENATVPWYPASVTKLMTAYVTLKAVREGKVTLDTLFTVSPFASAQSPSKMGFRPGTQVTVDNALKMMLVKSANDMAVVLAEGVGGSVDGFSAMMNQTAQRLGMIQTHYVNPNGLPADDQVTSARDLAILSRAIIKDLPEYEYFVHIPSIQFGRRITQNFNRLIGRYPGADGFKTGFICASGYNLVASATRDGRRLIAVVLGASSGTARAVRAAQLLDRGFGSSNGLSWLKPSLGTVDQLVPVDASPPNLRDEMCGGKRHKPASDEDDAPVVTSTSPTSNSSEPAASAMFLAPSLQMMPRPSELLAAAPTPSEPIVVYTGPTRTGAALVAAVAADADRQAAKRGKRPHVAAKKPEASQPKADQADAKPEAKPAKPAAVRHASAKGDATAKPAAPAADGTTKPKPKTAAKPKGESKPAPKNNSGDSKPAS
jgi:D-alanyl-D-alanine carboxypeptidase